MKLTRFAKYAWGILGYNLVVILWGAYVRASGSGAGCGSHWPLCNGEVIPRAPQIETIIEFSHRLSSGLSLILIVGLLVWALRTYPKGHRVRLGASLSMLFIITEALVGAGLVLFNWVAGNPSLGSAISRGVHLLNTFLLLASITITGWWASGGEAVDLRGRGLYSWGVGLGLLGVLVLGMSGAVTALGDTLFPATSLAEGLQQDFSPTANIMIRLRFLHPTIAVTVGIYLILLAGLIRYQNHAPAVSRFAHTLTLLIVIQVGAGVLNVFLLAPLWMQLLHLFLADAVWITLILLSAVTFARACESSTEREAPKAPALAGTHEIS